MESITLAVVGSGGAGVISLGEMILKSAASLGYFGLMRKSFGPQIRGGESAAILRLGPQPISNFTQDIHCLLVLDWNNFSRFGDEILLTSHTQIVQDQMAGAAPENITTEILTVDFSGAAAKAGSDKANMAMLGYVGAWLGCSTDTMANMIRQRLARLSAELQAISIAAMEQGVLLAGEHKPALSLPQPGTPLAEPWIATGNQLAGLGALEAGVRFVAAYPITPASDCLEWIANHIESVNGHLVQAEDELAAMNMIIGGGYAGVPSMTATSGPGLSLMSEAMGLAVSSETPVVVLNVMRGGPSTGIPTKSEQSDLNFALYGMHGDAPHIVLSALSIPDCFHTMAWATHLATSLQTLVIVLSDQFIGQSTQIMAPVATVPYQAQLARPDPEQAKDYARYQLSESGVSLMAVPGDEGCMYTADGLEHTEHAVPSPKAGDHEAQLAKRARKLNDHQFGRDWAEVRGEGDTVIICWGSLFSSVLEAQQLLVEQELPVRVVGLRLLMPLPADELVKTCENARRILVVEQNHQGQCVNYLRSLNLPNLQFHSYARPGPRLITPAEIAAEVLSMQPSAETK